MARSFEDLTPGEQRKAIDEIMQQWLSILGHHAGREARANFIGRRGRRGRRGWRLEAAEREARSQAIKDGEADSLLREAAEREARKAIYPAPDEGVVYLEESGWYPVDSRTESWVYVALARQLGGTCSICIGTGTVPDRMAPDGSWGSSPCIACDGRGEFEGHNRPDGLYP